MAERKTKQRRSSSAPALPKAERRQLILHAAREVFGRRGFHQATVEDIVSAAGVARGTFYLYYADKRTVFSELIDRFSARIAMSIVRIVTSDPARSVESQVRENIRGVIGTALAERTMTKILFTDAMGVDPSFDRRIQSFYDEVVQLLTESLREGQRLGIVGEGEPRVFAYLSLGALKELLYQAVTLGLAEESAEALSEQMLQFLSGGYLRLQGRHTAPARRPRAKAR